MTVEVRITSQAPYACVVLVKALFPNGRVSIGSGVVVGKNDVLTAAHVIYDPSRGGYANFVQVLPGADYNGLTGVMESTPFGVFNHGSISAWPERVFTDSSNDTTSLTEIPWDVALIGLNRAIGFEIGWWGLAHGQNFNQPAKEIGYPGNGTGMMMGDSYAYSANGALISAYSQDRSALLGPGSSGGPLYIDTAPSPSVLGIKSSGNSVVNYWADIDFLYDEIISAMNQNDQLIGGSTEVIGTILGDRFFNLTGSNVIDGLLGIDHVEYPGEFSTYRVFVTGSSQTVVIPMEQTLTGDVLTNVERLVFTDQQVALDTGVHQSAGQAVLLLGAVLPGQLALDPSKQELLGNVITFFDQGFTLEQLAGAVLRLPIWDVLTQKANPTNTDIANYLLTNLYARMPDAFELTVAANTLDTEAFQGQWLAQLARSDVNQVRLDLIGLQTTGISFQ